HSDEASSDFDGLGHYRTSVASASFNSTPTRTTTTHYNANTNAGTYSGAGPTPSNYMIAPSDPCLPALFDKRQVSEANQTTAIEEFCFNTTTGFLDRKTHLGRQRGQY